jgi:hypothetical protein
LTIINAGQAILDDAQAQIDALPTEKVVNITVTTDAPAVAAETATATTAADEDIEATIKALMDGNAEFETQFQLVMSGAQLAIGKTDLALDSMAGSEVKAGEGLVPLAEGEDEVAAGGDAIMGSMGALLSTLAPIAALFGIGLGAKATIDIMSQQTQATAALNNAFKDVKTSIPTSELDTLSTKMSNMGFSNVEVTQSLTNLTLATKSGSDAVVDESAAADLARYSHISLSAATNQLIKGSQGQARALKTLALEGLIPVINNEKAMAAAHAAVGTAQDALTTSTNSLSNAQIAYNTAVAEYGPNSSQAETADNSLQNAQISHQKAVDGLSTANTNLANKQKDLANPTWQMSQLTDELKSKIGGLAQAQSQTLGGAFDIVKAKAENFLGGAGDKLQKWFSQHEKQIMQVAGVIVGDLITAWGDVTTVISDVIGGIEDFYTSHKKILDDIAGLIVHDLIQYWTDVIKVIGLVVNAFEQFYDKNKAVIDNVVNVVLAALKIALEVIGWTLSNVVVPAFKIGLDIISTALQIVISIIEFVVDCIQNIVGAVQNVVNFTKTAFSDISGFIAAVGDTIESIIQVFVKLPGNIWNAILSIGGFFLKLGLQMDTDVVNFLATVLGFFTGLPGNIWNAIATGTGDVAGFFEKIGVTAISNVSTFIGSILDFFKKLPGEIWDFIKSVPGLIAKMVSNIPVLGGIIKGASSVVGDIAKAFAGGGVINEPIVGYGVNSGQSYSFGENGSEAVVPLTGAANGLGAGGAGGGNVQLIFSGNYLLSNNALTQFAQQVEQIVVTKLLPAGGRMVTLG